MLHSDIRFLPIVQAAADWRQKGPCSRHGLADQETAVRDECHGDCSGCAVAAY